MNFLAHLFLSNNSEKIAIGNFIADFVKGAQIESYEKDVVKGILIHREIDRFTDAHATVKQSKNRLWNRYRHYSSVIVDMYYDHFLAKNWEMYSDEPLKNFTTRHYSLLSRHSYSFPSRASITLKYMKQSDWLYNYQFLEGIDMALKGMSRRANFNSKMEYAIQELHRHYEQFNEEFHLFFPKLKRHTEEFSREI